MPSSTRYAAPASLTTVNADAASRPAIPRPATTAHTNRPDAMPAAHDMPARRPDRTALRVTITKSGPGDIDASRTTPPRATSCAKVTWPGYLRPGIAFTNVLRLA